MLKILSLVVLSHFIINSAFAETSFDTNTSSSLENMFHVKSYVLDNGLHVISSQRNYSDTLTLQMVVNIGLQDFPCVDEQVPHVLEHMLFEETSRFSETTMRKQLQSHGGSGKGHTVQEYTYYTLSIHSDYLPIAFDILFSMIAEPTLSDSALQNAIRSVHSEFGTSPSSIQNLMNNKRDLVGQAKSRLYPSSHLECSKRSYPNHITAEIVKSAYKDYYTPENMTLIVLGKFNEQELEQWISQSFAKLEKRRPKAAYRFPNKEIDYTPILEHNQITESEVNIHMMIPAVGHEHADSLAIALLNDYLSEQLFYKIRADKGIGYTPRSEYIAGTKLGILHAQTKTTKQWDDEVTHLFTAIYQEIRNNGIPENELARLKQKMILEFESKERTNFEIAQLYRHYKNHIKDTGQMLNLVDEIKKVDKKAIKATIDRHFPEKPLIATMRPLNNWEAFFKFLLILVASSIVAIPLFKWLKKRRTLS